MNREESHIECLTSHLSRRRIVADLNGCEWWGRNGQAA